MGAVDVLAKELDSKVQLDAISRDYICEPRLGKGHSVEVGDTTPSWSARAAADHRSSYLCLTLQSIALLGAWPALWWSSTWSRCRAGAGVGHGKGFASL